MFFRLILTPILIEGEEQRNNSGILLRLSISIPRADLKEVLKDASVPLLEFYRESVKLNEQKTPPNKFALLIHFQLNFPVGWCDSKTARNHCVIKTNDKYARK